MQMLDRLGCEMPVYVTRKNATGDTGTVSMSIGAVLLVLVVVQLNVLLWGAYGVVQAIGHLF